ncbi:MAG TPA: dockerin type I repeat-containing protein [Chthoniobacterales bacterium]|nr:dockerin type I repeat-containing protein [Chthoniobacterales bacterium]
MKKKKSNSAFFSLRTLFGLGLCIFGFAITFFAAGVFPGNNAQSAGRQQDKPGTQKPDIVKVVGPVSQDMDLNALPYIPPSAHEEEFRLTPHNWDHHPIKHSFTEYLYTQALTPDVPTPLIPAASVSFLGVNSATSGCGCLPPDTDGDVGPSHYVQSVNSGIKVFNKTTGAQLLAFTTYNSFFASLTGTPCNGSNDGDGLAIYDSQADRWVVTDFAFPAFPGTSFYQCIGISKTNSPVSGGWWLYALQVDPTNTAALGDYPKMAAWSDGYYLTMNEFTNNTTFVGVRVYALNRTSMLSGGATNAIGFTISAATLGNAYSLLPATYRFGAPPAGAAEYILAVDSTDNATFNTAVYAWRFHADFVTPSMSTLGIGPTTHSPNATITVTGFYDALEGTGASATTLEIPQPTTANREDTLGDKLMYPLYYQNLNGVESLWADQTVNTGSNATAFTNPTGIRWYQFIVTGGVLPAGAAQTQTFTNGNDGQWRFMPSLALDYQGDLAINYTAGNGSTNTGIRYAGRLAGDAANSLAQGEATLIAGGGHQTSSSGRWGDYSATGVDVSDSCSFYMTNEYYTANSSSNWATRVGAFKFATCLTPPNLVSVVSRFTHGAGAGTFDLTLSTSSRVVEPRTDFSGNYTIVFNFNVPVNSGSASTTDGSVGSVTFSGSSMIVGLTGVTDQQTGTVTATNVSGPGTGTLFSASVQVGFLIGDVTGDGTVNAGDTVVVRNNAGVTLNNTNFQNDVNVDGAVNVGDTTIVRNNSGHTLPP